MRCFRHGRPRGHSCGPISGFRCPWCVYESLILYILPHIYRHIYHCRHERTREYPCRWFSGFKSPCIYVMVRGVGWWFLESSGEDIPDDQGYGDEHQYFLSGCARRRHVHASDGGAVGVSCTFGIAHKYTFKSLFSKLVLINYTTISHTFDQNIYTTTKKLTETIKEARAAERNIITCVYLLLRATISFVVVVAVQGRKLKG